jgi:hypothetical protein
MVKPASTKDKVDKKLVGEMSVGEMAFDQKTWNLGEHDQLFWEEMT